MAEADETTTVFAAGRDGAPIGDWRDQQIYAQQDADAYNDLMRQAKVEPNVVVLQGTRTVTVTNVAPVGAEQADAQTTGPGDSVEEQAEPTTADTADTEATDEADTTDAAGYYPAR